MKVAQAIVRRNGRHFKLQRVITRLELGLGVSDVGRGQINPSSASHRMTVSRKRSSLVLLKALHLFGSKERAVVWKS